MIFSPASYPILFCIPIPSSALLVFRLRGRVAAPASYPTLFCSPIPSSPILVFYKNGRVASHASYPTLFCTVQYLYQLCLCFAKKSELLLLLPTPPYSAVQYTFISPPCVSPKSQSCCSCFLFQLFCIVQYFHQPYLCSAQKAELLLLLPTSPYSV